LGIQSLFNNNYANRFRANIAANTDWEFGAAAIIQAVPYAFDPAVFMRFMKKVPPHWGLPVGYCDYDFTKVVADDQNADLSLISTNKYSSFD
jgi:hypothetical protein